MKSTLPRFGRRDHNARSLALSVLGMVREREAFVGEILDQQLAQTGLPPADRRLATQLVYGVLRRLGTLDFLIRHVCSRPPHQVETWIWDTLRLGTYQLLLLDHIPKHAAIHETVELAVAVRRPRAKGFINGILRSLSRLSTAGSLPEPAGNALPMEGDQYRRLASHVFPDPRLHQAKYLAEAFSFPAWLAERWQSQRSWDECLRLGFYFAGPAPLWLRVNPLRTDRSAFLAELRHAQIEAEPGDHPQSVRLADHMPIRDIPGFQQGWFSVQDASAIRVASALNPQPGMNVLDLCAAPGGKTTHLAELMNNQGSITACDVDRDRVETISALCLRLGVDIVRTALIDAQKNEEPLPGPFDAVLVDVPCSNTGVLGRRPEARWRLKPTDFRRLGVLQVKLLAQAFERVKPGGAVVYSTCSIEPEENRHVVRTACRGFPRMVLEEESEQMPGMPGDGGYWVRLRRKE